MSARGDISIKEIKIMGAIDTHKNKVGKDPGEIAVGKDLGLRTTDDADAALSRTRPDVVLHPTGSYFRVVKPQLSKIVKYEADSVSTCQELAYPFLRHPELCWIFVVSGNRLRHRPNGRRRQVCPSRPRIEATILSADSKRSLHVPSGSSNQVRNELEWSPNNGPMSGEVAGAAICICEEDEASHKLLTL